MASGIKGIQVLTDRCKPSTLELEYVLATVEAATDIYPDLSKYVSRVVIRPQPELSDKAYEILDDDELYILRFCNSGGQYWYPSDVEQAGHIEIDYIGYVDFLAALVSHEFGHALWRAAKPDRSIPFKRSGELDLVRLHDAEWSGWASDIYKTVGCERASLVIDCMSYKFLRRRHTRLIPEHSGWAKEVWRTFDTAQFGSLRSAFTHLFG